MVLLAESAFPFFLLRQPHIASNRDSPHTFRQVPVQFEIFQFYWILHVGFQISMPTHSLIQADALWVQNNCNSESMVPDPTIAPAAYILPHISTHG